MYSGYESSIDYMTCKHFCPFCILLSHLWWCPLKYKKFNFDDTQFGSFLVFCPFGSNLRNCLSQDHEDLLSFIILILLLLTFRSLVTFEFIFYIRSFFCMWISSCPSTICWKDLFPAFNFLNILVRMTWPSMWALTFGLSVSEYQSVCLSFASPTPAWLAQ
jgi:hypothetical protein